MVAKKRTDDPQFDRAWELYPRRPDNSKAAARKAWDARLAEGIDPEEMIRGVRAYARYCVEVGKEPQFIKLAATFFGPSHHFSNSFEVDAPTPPTGSAEHNLLGFYEREPLV